MINELTIKGLKCFEEAEFHFKNNKYSQLGTSCIVSRGAKRMCLCTVFKGKLFKKSNLVCNNSRSISGVCAKPDLKRIYSRRHSILFIYSKTRHL